jgi:hypothetical protein
MNIISGEKLQSLAEITLASEKKIKFNKNFSNFVDKYIIINNIDDVINQLEKIKKYKIIFIYGDDIPFFFDNILKYLDNITLITHNGDNGIKKKFKSYTENLKIKTWYGVNCEIFMDKIIPLPIGIANSMWKHGNINLLQKVIDKNNDKDNILFFNFSIKTSPNKRKKIKKIIEKKFTFLEKVTQEEYLNTLSKHKFCISPPGNGIDCHRTWECLYLGVIPIVESHVHNLSFQDLPILVINDWNIITEKYLEKKYKEFTKKKFNLQKLDINYWKKIIWENL